MKTVSAGTRSYTVTIEGIGDITLLEDDIRSARRRAKAMFPKRTHTVRAVIRYRFCDVCESKPCCCPPKAKAV